MSLFWQHYSNRIRTPEVFRSSSEAATQLQQHPLAFKEKTKNLVGAAEFGEFSELWRDGATCVTSESFDAMLHFNVCVHIYVQLSSGESRSTCVARCQWVWSAVYAAHTVIVMMADQQFTPLLWAFSSNV